MIMKDLTLIMAIYDKAQTGPVLAMIFLIALSL